MTKPFTGNVRMEWFQSGEILNFTFYVKERLESDVKVNVTASSFDVTILLDDSGREYNYSVDPLYALLKESEAPVVVVKPMKVEITLHKEVAYQWPTLEGSEAPRPVNVPSANSTAAATAAAAASSPAAPLQYPNSKGRDWSNIKIDDDDEKPEGEKALDALFKQIYGNGSDEQRKAMIKSFTESGGTVLSTNWEDVGKGKVEVQPPKGMEAKKVDE